MFTQHAPEWLFWSARRIAAAIRAGDLTSIDVTEACLAHIAAVNPAINAVVQLAEDQALDEAVRYDRLRARGMLQGPLHGVPITLKDSLDTDGIVTTGGTHGRREFIPDRDASTVARLRQAGAVLLGKTNTAELTMGGETDNPVYGRTNNPYDVMRSPGGSSGGSAAILAAGGSYLELGSDTGGSIREPAHFCGLAGIKPTSGRTPLTGHIVPWGLGVFDTLTEIGPMARYVEDLKLALPLIIGPDGVDPGVVSVPLTDADSVDIEGLRIAWHVENGLVTPDKDLRRVMHDAVRCLEQSGAVLVQDCADALSTASDLLIELRDELLHGLLQDLLASYGTDKPGPVLQAYLTNAPNKNGHAIDNRLLKRIDAVRSEALRWLSRYDAVLSPPSLSPARRHGVDRAMDYADWSLITVQNLLGWPCGVVRAGTSDIEGLPVGIQVTAPPWREDRVLALLASVEHRCGGYSSPN